MNKGDVLNEIAALEEKIVKIKEDKTVWRMIWAGSTYNHGPYLRRLAINRMRAKIRRLQAKL
jgi:hypothetical protein